jgi:hypothetical protein
LEGVVEFLVEVKIMKKMFICVCIMSILFGGCSSANRSAISAWGRKHRVQLISAYDGRVIRQWETSGKIEQESQSDGIYFTDDATGKLVAVYGGPVIVEVE